MSAIGDILNTVRVLEGNHDTCGGISSVPCGEYWQFVEGVDYLRLKIRYPKTKSIFWVKMKGNYNSFATY